MTGAAALLVEGLRARGLTVAVAESLTGGAVGAAIAAVPGASAVFLGGVVAYATSVKAEVLGVDAGLLAAGGAVQAEVAEQMAVGVRAALGATASADVGIATTGVAGPGPAEGKPAGTVFVAVATRSGAVSAALSLDGDRQAVREAALERALLLAIECLEAGGE